MEVGYQLMEEVPVSFQGVTRTRLAELANQIANLKVATVTHLVGAEVDYVRTAPDLSSSPSKKGVIVWGATVNSPWPAGTNVEVHFNISYDEYPKLDALMSEEKNKLQEFNRLLEKVPNALMSEWKSKRRAEFKRVLEELRGRHGIR